MTKRAPTRRLREVVDGMLLLNKPSGMTSNRALQLVKRWLNAKKAGHTGSLDPAATGMLPLCFGEATKVSAYLLDADKTYRVVAELGKTTDTADGDGRVIDTASVPKLTAPVWQSLLDRFRGESQQIPPMYSALKQDGTRLYELARKGQVVERQPRTVRIDDISLLEVRGQRLVFRVRCSKGTYVRSLVEDIAKAAGTLAYTAFLHRESVAGFSAADMLDFSEAERLADGDPSALKARLLPVDCALAHWPRVTLDPSCAAAFAHGQIVATASTDTGLTRVYGDSGRFLGVGEHLARRGLAPRRVFKLQAGAD